MSKIEAKSAVKQIEAEQEKLLQVLLKTSKLSPDELKSLLLAMDNFDVVAKVFLLEGTPHVFSSSPMKYLIFREQVADRFQIGYQDVCIVGSAKLGFSPSPTKFGTPFAQTSDVDVVIISSDMFDDGTHELFKYLRNSGPQHSWDDKKPIQVDGREWRVLKDAIRNFVYGNVNPSHLPEGNGLREEIFNNIASTSALFLALEPQVFVSKIRCRIFRDWRAAEAYYVNSLRILKRSLQEDKGKNIAAEHVEEDDDIDAAQAEKATSA